MTPERYRRIGELFEAVLTMEAAQRDDFLRQECPDDDALRREVEAMLAARDQAASFMEVPAVELAAKLKAGAMEIPAGTKLGLFEILTPVGAGGMGEVYRARDTKLKRDVAIKILPDEFSNDPERVKRFQREAQALAALDHQNIAGIYDLQQSGTTRFLILEFVEGETLADILKKRGALPQDEVLNIAKQICDALESAHEKGIIHRDLKPANIKITPDGKVKVLDFGLAKVVRSETEPNSLSKLPTLSVGGTEAGVILGTPSYMSPEQAKGKAVDWRSDIWAFGVVLYEMLTGRMLFAGEGATETMAFVITNVPDWNALPPNLPSSIRELLHRCLVKDSRNRLQAIGDARILIGEAIGHPGEPISNRGYNARKFEAPSRSRRIAAWMLGTLVLVLALLFWAPWRSAPGPGAAVRLTAGLGADAALVMAGGAGAVLSPDGKLLAFNASGKERNAIYVRPLNQLTATPLSETEGARNLFFSPDGQWIAFFSGGKLKKISVSGGAAVTLCDAPDDRGASWSEDGNIFFAPTTLSPIFRVSSAGGTPEPLTALDRNAGEVSHRWPQALPGGHAVLFTVSSTTGAFDDASVAAVSLGTGEKKILQRKGYYGRYLPSGHLVYVHEATLFAAPFDLNRMESTGPSVPAIEGGSTDAIQGYAQFAFSNNGTAVFVPSSNAGAASIYWMDRQGKTVPMRNVLAKYSNLRFSPDGHRLAIQIENDLWLYEWEREAMTPLTFGPESDRYPVWTPDGRRIAFARTVSNAQGIYWMRSDGTGDVQRLTESTQVQFPTSWHPSGKFLAITENREQTSQDLMILPVEGNETSGWIAGKPTLFPASSRSDMMPTFSPDGRWLAYQSNESGRTEVYVQPFPGPGGKWRISTGGGGLPVWSRKSRELFYETDDSKIMVSTYKVEGDSFHHDSPRLLSGVQLTLRDANYNFDLHPDGDRFAVLKLPDASARNDKVVFIFNFFDELRRIAPVAR